LKRLLILDLDGTLIDKKDRIDNEKLKAIEQLREKFDITIATGRSYLSALYFAKLLNIEVPFICFDGALVCDTNGKEYFSSYIEKREVFEILNFIKKFKNCAINIFYKEKTILNVNMLSLGITLKHWRINQKIYLDEISNFNIYKIVLASYNFEVLKEVEMFLKNFRNSGYYIYPSGKKKGLYVMDISNKYVNKGEALKVIKNTLNYNFIVSIGDYINDLEMFKISNISIAPVKSHKAVKNSVQYVINNFEELLEILKNYD
jgi:hypothetical protein